LGLTSAIAGPGTDHVIAGNRTIDRLAVPIDSTASAIYPSQTRSSDRPP